jgi:hypothetical protein
MFGIEPYREPPSQQQVSDEQIVRETEAQIRSGAFIPDERDPRLWELHPLTSPLHAMTSALRRIKFKIATHRDTSDDVAHTDDLLHIGHNKLMDRYRRNLTNARQAADPAARQAAEAAAMEAKREYDLLMSYERDQQIRMRLDPINGTAEGSIYHLEDTEDPEVAEPNPYAIEQARGWKVRKYNWDDPNTEDFLLLKASKWNRLYHRRYQELDDGAISSKLPNVTAGENVAPQKNPERADSKRRHYQHMLRGLYNDKELLRQRGAAEDPAAAQARYDAWRQNFMLKVGNTDDGVSLDNPSAFFTPPFVHESWSPTAW